jgi:hypothetical protein
MPSPRRCLPDRLHHRRVHNATSLTASTSSTHPGTAPSARSSLLPRCTVKLPPLPPPIEVFFSAPIPPPSGSCRCLPDHLHRRWVHATASLTASTAVGLQQFVAAVRQTLSLSLSLSLCKFCFAVFGCLDVCCSLYNYA